MAAKRSGSSARGVRAAKSARRTGDEAIDFSDIPESTDQELARARRVGRGTPKQLIAIRIHPTLLAKLRRLAARDGKPYQTLIHELLEKAAKRSAA